MISISRLIDILGITDEAEVALLASQRDQALAYIQKQTNRYFGPVELFTEYIKGSGYRSIYLRDIPLTGGVYTTTVLEHTDPGDAGVAVLIGAADGFALRIHGSGPATEAELVRRGSGGVWTSGYDYAVTYSHGYAEDTGPDDIERLLIEMLRIDVAAGGEEVYKSEQYGGYSYVRFDDASLSDDASNTIAAWRRLVFA